MFLDPNDLICDPSVAVKSADKWGDSRVHHQSSKASNQLTSVEAMVEIENDFTVQSRRSSINMALKSSNPPHTIPDSNSSKIAAGGGTRSRLSSKSDGDSVQTAAGQQQHQCLSELIRKMLNSTALDFFAHGELKQLCELIVNLAAYFEGGKNALARWIANQKLVSPFFLTVFP